MSHRRSFLATALLAGVAPLSVGRAWADGLFPQRPVKLVVPNPPGGPSDIVARFLAESMRAELGQPLVIDNRPGAAGLIGSAAVANAPADGYTVLVTSRSNHIVAPLVQQGAQVDPPRDLAPVGLALRAVGILATPGKSPWRSLRDFIGQAKAQPGKLFYGSAGIGATNHIAIEQFKALAGIELVHVPYKGSGPLTTGLMAGEVQLALLDFSSAQPGLKGGTIVPLAQTAARRLASMSDVPTLAESGFPRYDPSFWIGLAVPRGTSPDVIARLNRALDSALADTQMKARAQVNGWELVGGAPQVLEATIRQDMADFPALVRRLDLKA
ncbi:Bug family tripartite tricarboxylate transporter substrate binding protein [Variovorax saccharolyticus]|uniref:Bug family tripartite tricarboxylate transporter substrate binding protein n=1 Tax=Variovorax saccharolyticus TaxID=3053516 RepID=UPI00257641E4|nr:tripartite tricarboxylate transporter substrate binding protein [Variovorax sp. J22R187]MDM0021239.1 tripartite tricarboxylate transporter substrate binding protein [Variovorax sp. J22R187]